MGSSRTARGTCAAVASPVLKISLVGLNDMPLVDMIEPPLTTVRIGHVAMGHPQPSGMIAPLYFFPTLFVPPFKSRSRLEAENAALRHQLTVLQRKVRGRVQFTNSDRLFFIQLYRLFPSVLKAITIIRPETLVRWHRGGFRRYWRWKSRSLGGRPEIASELRALIRKMSAENELWGAPRIHGELLKLGFEVAQSRAWSHTPAPSPRKTSPPPCAPWRSFARMSMPSSTR
jgi:hypothetical protein